MAEPIQGGGPVNSVLQQTPQPRSADEARETENTEA